MQSEDEQLESIKSYILKKGIPEGTLHLEIRLKYNTWNSALLTNQVYKINQMDEGKATFEVISGSLELTMLVVGTGFGALSLLLQYLEYRRNRSREREKPEPPFQSTVIIVNKTIRLDVHDLNELSQMLR